MSERSDRIAQAVADAFGAAEGSAARASWQVVCRILVAYFSDRWLEIYSDPTVAPGIWQSEGDPRERTPWPAKTMAFQFDKQATNVLLAIWVNVNGTATGWRRVWPGDTAALPFGDGLPTIVDAISAAGAGVAPTISRSDHKHKLKVYGGTMRSSGLGSPGDDDDDTVSKGTHDHPPGPGPSPMDQGAKLYTSAIPGAQSLVAKGILAPVRKWDNARCVFIGTSDSEAGGPLAHFTESGGVWTSFVTGAIPSWWIDGVNANPGGDLHVGDIVLVRSFNPDYTGASNEQNGPYEIVSLGWHMEGMEAVSEPIQLRRASTANGSGAFLWDRFINIESGELYSGHTFVCDTNEPWLDHDPIMFSDHGTSSIFKTIPDGKHGFGTLWTKVAGAICTWEKHGEGANGNPQPPTASRWLQSDWIPGLVASVGNYYLVLEDSPYDGLYQIQTVPGVLVDGHLNYTHVMRRVAEANKADTLQKLVVQIVADAGLTVFLDGIHFKQVGTIGTIDGDAPEWDLTETDPSPPTDCLLTFAQQGQAGAGYWSVSKTIEPNTPTPLWDTPIPTLAGTPGVTQIPAGRETLQLYLIAVVGWNPATNPGDVTATVEISNGPAHDLVFSSVCPVKLGPGPFDAPVQWEKDLLEAFPRSQDDLLGYNVRITSTCAAPVTVVFYYGDPSWRNWVQIAGLSFAIGGTDRHDLLTKDSRALPNQHPWEAVVLATPTLADGTNGLITLPKLTEWPDKVACRFRCVLPTTELHGFNATGLEDLDKIEVLITGGTVGNPKKLMHGSNMEAPFYPIHLKGTVIDGTMQSPDEVWLKGPAWCTFSFNKTGGYFWLREVSEYAT